MSYQFTIKVDPMVCKICGTNFDKEWSSGGVGAICEDCYSLRKELDLVELNIVRNIYPEGDTYEFESNIDGQWYKCYSPCGDWSYVAKHWDGKAPAFSVPVGYWELKDLYEKHMEDSYDFSI